MVVVTAANVPDPAGAQTLFARVKRKFPRFQRLFLIYTDGTDRGKAFIQSVFDHYGSLLKTVMRSGLSRPDQALDSRADLWVLERVSTFEPRLRRTASALGDIQLSGHDAPHAQASGVNSNFSNAL